VPCIHYPFSSPSLGRLRCSDVNIDSKLHASPSLDILGKYRLNVVTPSKHLLKIGSSVVCTNLSKDKYRS